MPRPHIAAFSFGARRDLFQIDLFPYVCYRAEGSLVSVINVPTCRQNLHVMIGISRRFVKNAERPSVSWDDVGVMNQVGRLV